MLREVRGLGTLVPEDTMLITARTDGRVERILIRPGTPVKADSIVMVMTPPLGIGTFATAFTPPEVAWPLTATMTVCPPWSALRSPSTSQKPYVPSEFRVTLLALVNKKLIVPVSPVR